MYGYSYSKKPKEIRFHRLPKRDAPTTASGDVATMLQFLSMNPHSRYTIKSTGFSSRYNTYSAKTVRGAIMKGYHDIDGYVFVNDISEHTVREWINGNWDYRKVFHDSRASGNVVFDFVKVPGIGTIDELYDLLKQKKLPLPFFIVHTSRNSFHALYMAAYNTWTKEAKLAYAFQFLGRPVPTKVSEFDIAALKAAGIDYSYLTQNTAMCKIRLPGSMRQGLAEDWVCDCKGWAENLVNVTKTEPEKIKLTEEKQVVKPQDAEIVTKNDEFYSKHYEKVLEVVSPYASKRTAMKLARHLTQRLGLLNKNQCQLSQEEISKVIGVTQPTVSRILRKMLKDGILKVQKDGYYRFGDKGGIAKTYGSGEALMSILKVVDEKLARRQIAEPYEAGSANDSMLKDIGVMYKCGIQDSDIVEICSIKMKDRGRKRKSDNEIRRAVALWDERSSHIRPPRPLVDPRSFFLIAGGG